MPGFDTRDLGSWKQDVATLAGSLVHEIKNPLSTLNINAQLLLEEFKHPSTPREQRVVRRLEVMGAEVGRIEEIVNTFLRFAQPQDLQKKRISVNDVLDELQSHHAEAMERSGIRVHYQPGTGLPLLELDNNLFYQALLNLVRNAQQAMPDGGELILKSHLRKDHVEVEVIDTGKGIPPEQLPKVFRPYFSSKADGTGLGLPTTLRIVRAHGGNIRVESDVGQGSRFIVSLPIGEESAES